MAPKKPTKKTPETPEGSSRKKTGLIGTIRRRVERQAKQDEVMESGLEYWQWTWGHFNWIAAAIVAVLLIWGTLQFIEKGKADSLEMSESLLSEAQDAYQSGESNENRDGVLRARLNQLFKDYANSRAARYGHALMGDYLLDQEDYTGAREHFQKAMAGATPAEKAHFSISIGKTWESEGNDSEAISVYREALESYPDTVWGDALHFNLAAALERAGQDEAALEQYEAVAQGSSWYFEAKQRIDWLKAPVPKLTPAGGELAS